MAYIGVPPYGQTIRSVTNITATSGQTTFNITGGYQVGYVDVYLNGVLLVPGTDFTATDTLTVELTSGATTGDNFQAFSYQPVALVDTYRKSEVDSLISAISVTPTDVSSQANTATDYFDLPSGTTAQRPASPATGMSRFNSTTGFFEFYDGIGWVALAQPYSIEYLVVAGGGGGGGTPAGGYAGGGGGAGGYLAGTSNVQPLENYTVTIGPGGPGGVGAAKGTNGTNSSFGAIAVAIGGGGGGYFGSANGLSGGSGGGGCYNGGVGGSNTTGQGFSGGNGNTSNGTGAGGGGAGAAASNISGAEATNGGVGLNWQSLGTYYAGGGAGGNYYGSVPSQGGNGGGGDGGLGVLTGGPTSGSPGDPNTGGGGGGAGADASAQRIGGSGGSGIIIVRYLGGQRGSGGTVTSAGGYTYHTFTSSGTFTA